MAARVVKVAPLACPPPGSALRTPARHGRAATVRDHVDQSCSPGTLISAAPAVFLTAQSSSSRPLRLGRPCGPSYVIGFADPRPSGSSVGLGACEEGGATVGYGLPCAGSADASPPTPKNRRGYQRISDSRCRFDHDHPPGSIRFGTGGDAGPPAARPRLPHKGAYITRTGPGAGPSAQGRARTSRQAPPPTSSQPSANP